MSAFWDKLLRSGYSDLGPIDIAPTSQAIVLTDRADGTLYMISWNTIPPITRLSITTDFGTIQRREGIRLFAADDGPVMSKDGEFKLIIRSGRLGFEYTPFPTGTLARSDPFPFARTKFAQKALNMDTVDPITTHIELLDG